MDFQKLLLLCLLFTSCNNSSSQNLYPRLNVNSNETVDWNSNKISIDSLDQHLRMYKKSIPEKLHDSIRLDFSYQDSILISTILEVKDILRKNTLLKINLKLKPRNSTEFNITKDLLLLHYDCKTDVDDLHSIAAAGSLIRLENFSMLNFHAVAGTYGIQEGLYVPGESLFESAFGENWSDAHNDYEKAIDEVLLKSQKTLNDGGKIWIAEAGQSDFSADLIIRIIEEIPWLDTRDRIKVVQHSDWNESVTDSTKLSYVSVNADYKKIPDGNAIENGTPGFNSKEKFDWQSKLEMEELKKIWKLAIELANEYNGKENRYLNQTIKKGGFDFSDFSEVHYILNLENVDNCNDYFDYLQINN